MQQTHPFIAARDFLLAHRSDYQKAVDGFTWPEQETFNWALDYFDVMAAGNDQPALQIVNEQGTHERYSFAQLSRRSNQVANYLVSLGVLRGDRILLMLGNEVSLWETMLAAFKLGAVVIPASELLVEADLADRLERGKVRFIVTNSRHSHKFKSYLGSVTYAICTDGQEAGWQDYGQAAKCAETYSACGVTRVDDPLLLYFTSGTTSKPKLVLHSHQSYPVGSLSTMYWIGLMPGDLHLNISSPGWAKHAWSCFFAPWNAGACIFIYNSGRFSARGLLETLASYPVTSLCAPPTVWRMLIQEDLPAYRSRLSLRELVGAGEPLNPEIIDQVQKAWGITLRDGFGQSETTALIGNTPGQEVKPGSMGRPLPGYRVALLNAEGVPAQEGEVALYVEPRPKGLMLGYQDAQEQTDKVLHDGFYRTGDTATVDADGYVSFVGRSDDVFKSSDYRISPFELESALIEHDAVAEVAIVPSPDPVRLVVPKAFIVLRQGVEADRKIAQALFEFTRGRLAPYKRIRRLEFVAELPKTISGKIRRVELRLNEESMYIKGDRSFQTFTEEDF